MAKPTTAARRAWRNRLTALAVIALVLYVVGPTVAVREFDACPFTSCSAKYVGREIRVFTTHPLLRLFQWNSESGITGFGVCNESGVCR
jgi:hypothetical protein